ncbi:response regulator transcription factor [Geomonas sp. RF6]|uniref:response regulator transcription factor n=1 Tax=Geomonas sp. RF6 TaxID=2897342 RepID=UPI001E537AC0|nr:response regulator transcription factor [Geomonas sp. RF6]UFS71423.1 response regulator transcription factor [Geomonas sp. RF6]
MSIRVVVADHHPVTLAGLKTILAQQSGIDVVATCANGNEAIEEVRNHKPDVLLLELGMPGLTGLQVAKMVLGQHEHPKTVILTAAIGEKELIEAIETGINGIFLKELPPDMLIECIERVHSGDMWLDPGTAYQAVRAFARREKSRDIALLLSPREMQLVEMVVQNRQNREIAECFCITEGTVKVHLHNIYEKLNVNGREGLLKFAKEHFLVS